MQRVLFHCGSAKTGSTAIQQQVFLNDDILKNQGIFYCPRFVRAGNVDPLNLYLRDLKFKTDHLEKQMLVKAGQERLRTLEAEGFHTVIISNESALGDPFHDRKTGFFPHLKATAPYVKELFKDVEVIPLFVIRNVASLLPSFYVQRVRQGGIYSAEDYYDQVCAHDVSWIPVVQELLRLFPSAERRVVSFEWLARQEQSLGQGLFGGLLPEECLKLDRDRPSNRAAGQRALTMMRMINRMGETYAGIVGKDPVRVQRELRDRFFPIVEKLGGEKLLLKGKLGETLTMLYQQDLRALNIAG